MKDLMLDLETMGTKPGCAILSIGAIIFDHKTGKLGDIFYTGVKLSSCVSAGLHIDPHTVLWWLEQSGEARAKLKESQLLLQEALHLFSNFKQMHPDVTDLWGNSASFDMSILRAAYDIVDMPAPWSPWSEKCYRTITKLFPGNYKKKDPTKAHDPIYDCEYQIEILAATMQKLNGRNYV